jgi:hypothetical protein
MPLAGLKRALPIDLAATAAAKSPTGRSVLAAVVAWMTDAGRLAMVATPGPDGEPVSGWARAPQAYAPFEGRYGPLRPCVQEAADARLAAWYFAAHGPATVGDWTWWAGLGRARAGAAFEAVRRGLIGIVVDGWPDLFYAPPDALDGDPAAVDDERPVVCLLPYEDSAIKAYRATRGRFFDPAVGETAHTRYGEVLPTVLVDGRIVGTWSSGAGGWAAALGAAAGRPERRLGAELLMPVAREVRRRLDAELARLAGLIGAPRPDAGFVDAPASGG